MSRYITEIGSGRGNNLSLSQFVPLRFLTYLLYDAYVLHRAFAIEHLLKEDHAGDDPEGLVRNISEAWKRLSIRSFVAQINKQIREKGSDELLPGVFLETTYSPEEQMESRNGSATENEQDHGHEEEEELRISQPDTMQSVIVWPTKNRLQKANMEPWRSARLNKTIKHEAKHLGTARACVVCTKYHKGRPVKKAHTSVYGCSGCGLISMCRSPGTDGRVKCCWDRWHSTIRLE